MNRRDLLRGGAAVVGSHALVSFAASAQSSLTYRVIIRMPGTAKDQRDFGWIVSERLGEQLARFGFVEGRNLELVNQYLGDRNEPTQEHLAEIRARKTHAIVSVNAAGTIALRERVSDIPIVAWAIEDPVGAGLAESFTRPGGNVTGLTQGKEAVFSRQVEVLAKLVPRLSGIAVFGYRGEQAQPDTVRQFEHLEATIRDRGLRHISIPTVGPGALEAMPRLREQGVQAAIYFHNPHPLGRENQRRHADAAIASRIATLGYFANLADDGFLVTYGELDADLFLRLAQQVDRVLRGASPATLPFMGPQRFHLRINRRTADALGMVIPADLRILANDVIG